MKLHLKTAVAVFLLSAFSILAGLNPVLQNTYTTNNQSGADAYVISLIGTNLDSRTNALVSDRVKTNDSRNISLSGSVNLSGTVTINNQINPNLGSGDPVTNLFGVGQNGVQKKIVLGTGFNMSSNGVLSTTTDTSITNSLVSRAELALSNYVNSSTLLSTSNALRSGYSQADTITSNGIISRIISSNYVTASDAAAYVTTNDSRNLTLGNIQSTGLTLTNSGAGDIVQYNGAGEVSWNGTKVIDWGDQRLNGNWTAENFTIEKTLTAESNVVISGATTINNNLSVNSPGYITQRGSRVLTNVVLNGSSFMSVMSNGPNSFTLTVTGLQPTSQNLTNWAQLSTNTITGLITNVVLLATNITIYSNGPNSFTLSANHLQTGSQNLTNWSQLSTNVLLSKQTGSQNLTNWSQLSTNAITGLISNMLIYGTNISIYSNGPNNYSLSIEKFQPASANLTNWGALDRNETLGQYVMTNDSRGIRLTGHLQFSDQTNANLATSGKTNIFGIGSSGEQKKIVLGTGFSLTSSGVLNVSSVNDALTNNYNGPTIVINTNTIINGSSTWTAGTNVSCNLATNSVTNLVYVTNSTSLIENLVKTNGSVSGSSTGSISILSFGIADPYGSTATITNYGKVSNVTVTITGFQHYFPSDVLVELMSPSGTLVRLFAGAGGLNTLSSPINLVFSDSSTSYLPENAQLSSGTYHPGDYLPDVTISSPANGAYTTNLSSFNGDEINGDWKLYVYDDEPGAGGAITSWSLSITPTATANTNYVTAYGAGITAINSIYLWDSVRNTFYSSSADRDIVHFAADLSPITPWRIVDYELYVPNGIGIYYTNIGPAVTATYNATDVNNLPAPSVAFGAWVVGAGTNITITTNITTQVVTNCTPITNTVAIQNGSIYINGIELVISTNFSSIYVTNNSTFENDITANFKDGILNIEITKKLENSTKNIEVKAQ